MPPHTREWATDRQVVQQSGIIEVPLEMPVTENRIDLAEAVADTAQCLPGRCALPGAHIRIVVDVPLLVDIGFTPHGNEAVPNSLRTGGLSLRRAHLKRQSRLNLQIARAGQQLDLRGIVFKHRAATTETGDGCWPNE